MRLYGERGGTHAETARELGVDPGSPPGWIKRADAAQAPPEDNPFQMAEDLRRLRRENERLKGVDPTRYASNKEIVERLNEVRRVRLSSPTKEFNQAADTPWLFVQDGQPDVSYLAAPKVSSQRRTYLPVGWLESAVVATDQLWISTDSTLYDFGTVCQAVLHGQEHVLLFNEKSYCLASACCKPLHYLPYRVTLAKTSGISSNWGIAALSEPDGISVFPIGKSADIHIGCNLLAFVENECSAVQLEDGGCDYVGKEVDYAHSANDLSTKIGRRHYIDGASSATRKSDASIRRGPLERYTRRAHQRRQHFGPKGMYVKIIRINEAIVFPKGIKRDPESLSEGNRVHHVRI